MTKLITISAILFTCLFIFQVSGAEAQSEPTPLTKAVYLTKEGDYELAIEYCNQAIDNNPKNADAYYLRGFARYNMNNYEAAIKDFDTTVSINNHHADAYLYRGNCKKELNKYWSALRDYRKAKDIAPSITNMYMIKNLVSALFS